MAEDFLSFLVNETLELQKSGEVQLSSLELKLNDYGLVYIKGEFIPQTQMLRFNSSLGVLDIPVNWQIFNVDTVLDSENDNDRFLSVMKAAWNPAFEKMLITHADGFCYLVGLKLGEDSCLHDLLNPQIWLKAA